MLERRIKNMEANENTEATPEVLPTETAEETKPKKTKILAVVIVLILIVAALAVALGLGGGGTPTNAPPTAGAIATTNTTIPVGGSVTFKSTSNDTNGNDTIAALTWYFGDGTTSNGTVAAVGTVNHTFQYGGLYWVLLKAVDDKGANSTTEASMIRITVTYFAPTEPVTNTSAPKAVLNADQDIIDLNTIVVFNASGSKAVGQWHWINATNHSEGGENYYGYDNITSLNLTFGDGSDAVEGLSDAMTNNYKTAGHYAASLNVTGENGKSTKVMRTIHVKGQQPSTIPVKNPDSFIMASIGGPQYLDPAIDYETAGGEVLQNVYETLIWYDGARVDTLLPILCNETPSAVNGLIGADGMNYTFNLKTGVKMHDGTTMNADDVIYSLQRGIRIHDPDGPSFIYEGVITDMLSYSIGDEVQNWSGQFSWPTPAWMLALMGNDPFHVITESDVQAIAEGAITKINASAINIRLTHPQAAFLQMLAFNAASVVSKEYVELKGGVVNGAQNDHMNQNTCGSGPYKLVSWASGIIHMTRFADYHGTAPAIKDVYIRDVSDVNTRILMLKAGDADSIYLPIDFESLFTNNSNYRIIKGLPTFDQMIVGFNWNINTTAAAVYGSNVPSDFFTDVHVRRAFVHMFDYTGFIAKVLMGNGIQPNGVIPKGLFGYNASQPMYNYDLAMAEAELKLAINGGTGNSWWDDGFDVAFFYNSGNTYRETACLYMKTALESMGTQFGATVNSLIWAEYLTQLQKKPSPFPMFYIGWAPDYPDPDDFATPLLDSTWGIFPYRTGYMNATIDTMIRDAAAETNDTVRYQLYQDLTEAVYQDVPYIWMYQANNFHIERSWVGGYYYNPMYGGFYYPSFTKG
jgi:peptide/nickel transport system substrate-binding protein